jgi:Mrp family chromosome partitioning ATPase
LVARRLAVKVTAAIAESGRRAILLTSPNEGDGKSFLVRILAPELEKVAPHRFHLISAGELAEVNPWAPPDDRILLVDGPAVLEGAGFLNIRKGWISAFDGALVVAVARKTKRQDLEETISWLNASKIPPIGLIWNEVVCPPLGTRLRIALRRLRRLVSKSREREVELPESPQSVGEPR